MTGFIERLRANRRLILVLAWAAFVAAAFSLAAAYPETGEPRVPGLRPVHPPAPLSWPDDPWRWACVAFLLATALWPAVSERPPAMCRDGLAKLSALFRTGRRVAYPPGWTRGLGRRGSWSPESYASACAESLGPTAEEAKNHPGYRMLASVLYAAADRDGEEWVQHNADAMRAMAESGHAGLPEVNAAIRRLPIGYGHAYARTICLSVLEDARRNTPVPSAALSWVSRFDPTLYAAISSLGRPSVLQEAVAVIDHYNHERAALAPLAKPHVGNACKALAEAKALDPTWAGV